MRIRFSKARSRAIFRCNIPEPYQLHLNKKAAAAIGLTLPADLLAEADKVLS